jgi:hypothetical protein
MLICHSLPGGRIDMVEVSTNVAGALIVSLNRYWVLSITAVGTGR